MSDFWAPAVVRRARKTYRCAWCGEFITPGEMYTCTSGHGDGVFQLHRWHRECWGAFFLDCGDDPTFTLYAAERPIPRNST